MAFRGVPIRATLTPRAWLNISRARSAWRTSGPHVPRNRLGGSKLLSVGSEYSRFVNQTSEVNDDVSWIHGRHRMKFGFDTRRQQFNVARRENGSGLFSFDPRTTADPVTGNGGHAWASFLLGEVYSSNVRVGLILRNQWNYYGMYAQDDFKLSPKLTLNYGLRYEIPYRLSRRETGCRDSIAASPTREQAAG